MPKNSDIKSILIIGSGPIIIGQACEFDYSGTQACKALREEGYRIILVNSNPATIMTDPELADATYIEPITLDVLEAIIDKERPDSLLPTLGGQTALNYTLALAKKGVLDKYKVKLIGASLMAIELAENRTLFRETMLSIGLEVPEAYKVSNINEANALLEHIQFPVIIRSSFTLAGAGAGIAHNSQDYHQICENAFALMPLQEIMIDEALIGWKEFELEVVRDRKDNCIIVCGVENLDPLGIHTGDSITVAPIQTLTDKEYQKMRQAAFAVLRAIGVDTGGSNVQFAVHPKTGRMVVIEMNPRVSRSSALVSKASGFPIAKVAAKLAVGYTLDELKNDITNQLPASFEPSLDYVVVKIPRFNAEKFPDSPKNRGPMMHSVGEVMSIGRTFIEALQKAVRSLEIGQDGLYGMYSSLNTDEMKTELKKMGPTQIWAVAEAFRRGFDLNIIHEFTQIDPWFLDQILLMIQAELGLKKQTLQSMNAKQLKNYKMMGFSAKHIATILQCQPENVLQKRQALQIEPVYKRVDSCAAEFPTSTAYLYSSFEKVCEANPTRNKKMLIIGSGPNRIGQGIEFDYCCVQSAKALKKHGYETIMVNCNPETVSTDYDVVDRLYCSPLTLEEVTSIIKLEKPEGVFVQFGGQTPLLLAEGLAETGVNLMGLDIDVVRTTEDRGLFKDLLHTLNLKQPENYTAQSIEEALKMHKSIGFPIIVRPSFVLGGAAMSVVNNENELKNALDKIQNISAQQPVLLESFLKGAIEVDVDAISDGNNVFIPGLLEHIESAGIHSGDSACVVPSIHLPIFIQQAIQLQTKAIAQYLKIKGAFNIQFAVQNNVIYILEVNPRVSRTLPFLCKATGLPLVQIAIDCILGKDLTKQNIHLSMPTMSYYCVKEAVLPFNKFPKSPPLLGPEMKSTGEVMGIGKSWQEAYAKAEIATQISLPQPGNIWVILSNIEDEPEKILPTLKKLINMKYTILTEKNCGSYLREQEISCKIFNSIDEVKEPIVLVIALNDLIKQTKEIISSLFFAISKNICYVTTHQAAMALSEALEFHLNGHYEYRSLQSLYRENKNLYKSNHLLTGEELLPEQIERLLSNAAKLKRERKAQKLNRVLENKQLAMIFDKPSLRTKFSFTVAMRELGGDIIESLKGTRKDETPEELASILSGYCDAMVVRTHADETLERMSRCSSIPIINGLSDLHHPCQILADFLTLQEVFNKLQNITISYIGDGNNILQSLLLLAPKMGVNVHYCCPSERRPQEVILKRCLSQLSSNTGKILDFATPEEAVCGADVIYTDVWSSMGFEETRNDDLFNGFQVNEVLMQKANPYAVFMHCLPMERGKEVSESLPEQLYSVIYRQSENRLHMQKAILLHLLAEDSSW